MSGTATPVPVSDTVLGLPAASCSIDRLAVRGPLPTGAKLTSSRQLAPAASVAGDTGQPPAEGTVTANCAPSPPPTDTRLIVSPPVPLFLTVTARDALVRPDPCSPKARLDGDTSMLGVTPRPTSATVVGVPVALCAISTLAVFEPGLPGVNVTLTVQLPPGASDAAQPVSRANCPASAPPSVIALPAPPAKLSSAVAVDKLLIVTVRTALVRPTR